MDEDFQQSYQHRRSIDRAHLNVGSNHQPEQHEPQCLVCRREFSLETEMNEGFGATSICRDCKFTVLDDNDISLTMRDFRRRRRNGVRNRFGSSESIEDLFSQQFSQLISLARQNHDAHADGDSAVGMHHMTSHNVSRSTSRRWRTFSDYDSDSVDYVDSLFAESDSVISFGGYGGESDASVDGDSIQERRIFVRVNNENPIDTDTDIDPMHAGLNQWNSDDEDEDDGGWEAAEVTAPRSMESPTPILDSSSSTLVGNSRWILDDGTIGWRVRENRFLYYPEIFSDMEGSETPPYVGNPGDYVDARGFEELLEQLVENDGSRRGAPPAAAWFVERLSSVIISKEHEKNGSLVCPVCKDSLTINTKAKQLPCMHLYHSNCILPWLRTRNSCPVCRYELPTDDREYEEGKQRRSSFISPETVQQGQADISSDVSTTDMEAEEVVQGNNNDLADESNREGGGGRWLILAAAPIVSILGAVLILWLQNPLGNARIRNNQQEGDLQWLHVGRGISAPTNRRNRRWWSLF